MVRLPGNDVPQARLFPLACGIGSMFLFRSTARRYLSLGPSRSPPRLFALSDWLIYYSSEIKQYSCDLTLALVALLLAAGPVVESKPSGSPPPGPAPLTTRRLLSSPASVWSGSGSPIHSPWCSRVSERIGSLSQRAARHGDNSWASRERAWPGSSSFAPCYVVSHRILSKERFIWDWWDFAFLPIPPRSLDDWNRDFWQILNAFDSPADLLTPLGVLNEPRPPGGDHPGDPRSRRRRRRPLLRAPLTFAATLRHRCHMLDFPATLSHLS